MRSDHDITTAFILASGPFTGGLLWERVGDRLREAGAEVHAANLTGMDTGTDGDVPPTETETERERDGDAEVDLETHIADVVRLIDRVAAPEVVLVGHGYAIHPVLGAAQQRVKRVARIVYLDCGLPQNGDAAVASVPDAAVQALLRESPGTTLPVPEPDQWQSWGSTAGLSAADLDRLRALAAPQPGRTLTQPLRLTGALTGVPTSGILCTAGGVTIAAVQALVSSGMPQFQALADPAVGFFELATGHWPMLSCPDELAATLLRAAAGDGHRLSPAVTRPFQERPFLLDAPHAARVRIGNVDLHLPEPRPAGATGARYPAVLFVHGGPLPRDMVPAPRDWPLYLGYARLAASEGVVGAVVAHRLHTPADYPTAAADVADALELLRADPRVDPERIAVWFFSGAGLLLTDYLAAPPPWLRCVAATYPVLAVSPGWRGVDPRFAPAAMLPKSVGLPIVLTRAGLESPEIAETVSAFLAAGRECSAAVELVDVPEARHGFDAHEPTERTRAAVRRAMDAVCAHLRR
ncbi:alpha/beta hydrolase [Streptacidiphilus neutrinimicus]|uniref:alpha/beta hydrolase n=1 Tax=Streptacidiphilus neutrinimicus TaxID=105420 RepID=UPI0005A9FA7E|nr:dienelactone hydrolase family protein [Streptacidiphilus neutrinimicus]